MKGKAAVLKAFGEDFILEDVIIPEPTGDEVLIRVRASGLCGTDLHIQEGKIASVQLPYIPGHEMAGEVFQIGSDVQRVAVGDRVSVHIDISCQTCEFCRSGRSNICQSLVRIGFERDGSHQEYCIVPEANVFKVGKSISFAEAAVIPDAVACSYHAVKAKARVNAGDYVCVLGVGGVGLHTVQFSKLFGAKVIATSRTDEKLELSRKLGADHVINTATHDLEEEIKRITGGRLCDVVFDNIGIEGSIQLSLDICKPGGKAIIVGYIDTNFSANYQDMMKHEKEIIGIRGSTPEEMQEVIRLVEERKITPFIYKTYPLADINKAAAELRSGKSLGRIVLVM